MNAVDLEQAAFYIFAQDLVVDLNGDPVEEEGNFQALFGGHG